MTIRLTHFSSIDGIFWSGRIKAPRMVTVEGATLNFLSAFQANFPTSFRPLIKFQLQHKNINIETSLKYAILILHFESFRKDSHPSILHW